MVRSGVLTLCEMQSSFSRIWTPFVMSISSDDNCCILICWFIQKYTYIYWIHTDAMITDAVINDARRKTQEDFLNNIFTSHLLQGFERVVQGLDVRGCWRPNINFIFWPHCYDRHVVSFLFSWCWGQLHRGFSMSPSVGCGLPYHI